MCGRYTIFSDTEQRDIRDIIDEVQRKSIESLKPEKSFHQIKGIRIRAFN